MDLRQQMILFVELNCYKMRYNIGTIITQSTSVDRTCFKIVELLTISCWFDGLLYIVREEGILRTLYGKFLLLQIWLKVQGCLLFYWIALQNACESY